MTPPAPPYIHATSRPLRAGPLLLGIALAVLSPRADALPFNCAADFGVRYDDNLSHGAISSDKRDDTALSASLSADQPLTLSRDWLFSWGGTAGAEHWLEYDAFDRESAQVRVGLRRRFGLGWRAPSLRLDLSGGWVSSRIDGNSGWIDGARLSYSHRPTEWLQYGASIALDDHEADQDFFTQHGTTFSTEVQVYLSDDWSAILVASQRQGDILAFGKAPVPWRNDSPYLSSVPVATFHGFDEPLAAYPINATTRGIDLTLNYALATRLTLRFGASLARSERDGLHYVNHIGSVGIIWQF